MNDFRAIRRMKGFRAVRKIKGFRAIGLLFVWLPVCHVVFPGHLPATSETICRLRRLLNSPRQPVSQSACSKLTVRLPRHRPNANALRYGKWILDNKYLPQILPWVPSGEELNVLLWKNCPTLSAKNTHWDPICSLTIPKLNSNYLGQNTKPVVRPRWREYAYYNLGFEVNELMIRKLWNTYHHYKLGRP